MQALRYTSMLTCLKDWPGLMSAELQLGLRGLCSTTPTISAFRVCVVGSGPAGMYTTDRLLKAYGQKVHVDIVDRLPTPFGLVRSGVAPDHPDTKNVTKQFMEVIADQRCSFLGNVTIGKDVSLATMQEMYHAVVLAYGAEGNRQLQIPGQNLSGVLSAREFVWWYNGHPEYADSNIDLSSITSVAICGLGNVAVDCARILLQPVERLASTDIAEHALQQLRRSSVRHVHLIGRRGPVQAAFTPKELREVLSMEGVHVQVPAAAMKLTPLDQAEMNATRMKKRVYDILKKAADKPADGLQASQLDCRNHKRQLHLHFLRSPVEVLDSGDGGVAGLRLEVNTLQTSSDNAHQWAVGTGQHESLDAQLVLESIGYKSYPLSGAPFDDAKGIIPNTLGRISTIQGGDRVTSGLYVCGWLKRGPSGIIGTNLWDAQQTVDTITEDFPPSSTDVLQHKSQTLQTYLQSKSARVVDFSGYCNIDKHEVECGSRVGKPREKVTNIQEMLHLAVKKQS